MGSERFGGRFLIPLVLIVGLWLTGCGAGMSDSNTIFGGTHTVESGDVIRDDVTQFGGTLIVEEGAAIAGDLTMLGGSVMLDGAVEGEVTAFGGTVVRGPNSSVDDITMFGGRTYRSDGRGAPVPADEPRTVPGTVAATGRSMIDRVFGVFQRVFSIMISAIGLGLVGLLTAMFLPERVRHVARAASEAPAATVGVGCLSMPVLFVATLLLIITIIGAPLLAIITALALVLGTVGIGYAIGDRLLRAADLRSPRVAAATAIGSAVLMLGYSVLSELPLIGFLLGPMLGAWALGAVILTRGGEKPYPARVLSSGSVPYTPAPPVPASSSEEETLSTDELLSQLATDLQLDDEDEWNGEPPAPQSGAR